jgi:hypothetical protein
MAGSRSRWWTRRDAQRLIARADASNYGVISRDELAYFHHWCCLLLTGPLDLSEYDRERVANLHRWVLAALASRDNDDRLEDGQP